MQSQSFGTAFQTAIEQEFCNYGFFNLKKPDNNTIQEMSIKKWQDLKEQNYINNQLY